MPKRCGNESDSSSQSSHKKLNGFESAERTVTIDHTKQPDYANHQFILKGYKLGDGLTDIKFVVDNEEIPAHKQVIEVLKTKRQLVREAVERDRRMAREENTEEATIFQMSGTTPRAFRKLLEYIYYGKVVCDLSTGIELAATAFKLKFHDLVASLAQLIEYNQKYCLNLQTVDDIYHIAKNANNSRLITVCSKFMDEMAYDLNQMFLRKVSQPSNCKDVLVYAFDKSRYINYIHFLIPDKYDICFTVSVSADENNWTVVLKNDDIYCKFWNWVYFEEKRIKFIKIKITDGLRNSQSANSFRDDHFLCKRANCVLEFDKSSGYLIPKHDVIKFPIRDTKYFFDELQPKLFTYCMSKSSPKDKLRDYYYHNIGDGKFIEFYLSQTCLIDSFRIWLWDKDDRTYDFKVEVKDEVEDEYVLIKDDNNDSLFRNKRSWQTIHLRSRRPVRWIRLVGIRGPPHDSEFAVVDVECPPQNKK